MRDKELYHERTKLIVKKFDSGLNDEEKKRLEEIQTYLSEKNSAEMKPHLDELEKMVEEIERKSKELDRKVEELLGKKGHKLRVSFGKPMNYIDYLKYLKGEGGDLYE